MHATSDALLFNIFLIFFGASLLATLALYVRQSLLVGYILLGLACGPAMLGWVGDAQLIGELSHIGIVFLLFLLGMNLPPQKLRRMLGSTLHLTLASSLLLTALGTGLGMIAGLSVQGSMLAGAALLFSSTIIGLKLLPTTVLHHQRTGGTIISILLLQDVIAVVVLLLVRGGGGTHIAAGLLALPLCAAVVYLLNRFVLLPLLRRFDVIQEYVFLLAIGWCLGMAQLAVLAGLSLEIGAFMAGVALASSPVSLHIAERLKPLRDFFLVIFFFSVGAGFQPGVLAGNGWLADWLVVLLLAAVALWFKPWLFAWLLRREGEEAKLAGEVGVRLGQMSEFSLLIAVLAAEQGVIGAHAAAIIQAAALFTFIVSSWRIVRRYPTPMATDPALRRD